MQRDKLTKAQRCWIADRLAEDRLASINASCGEVRVRDTLYTRYVKRTLDIAVALFALLLASPVIILLAAVTFFALGSSVLFRQERVGKDGRLFTLCKFRSMTDETDERGELLPPSERVTAFGRFIRKTSLDELLCFWSVLKGDMSLIGPRALLPEYVHRYSKRHRARLAVRPGLECPPRSDTERVWTWGERFENDVWYVENVSFLVDCRLAFRIVQFVFDRKYADVREKAGYGAFMGYSYDGKAITLEDVPDEYLADMIIANPGVVYDA